MGNSLRCCLACVLPCGALDLIRIVHLNGRVEEYGRPVAAGEILAANPNHVLSKPCCSQGGAVAVRRTILIVSPDSELERGEIYFLIPASSVPDKKKKSGGGAAAATPAASGRHGKSKQAAPSSDHGGNGRRHVRDVSSEKRSSSLHRRRMSTGSRTAAWRPHLECIVEDT
ncbi:hypothetical protein EE612_027338 [Oryza sativa]|nr:hypothetical protein EE612_027338 [Oryza sativa]